METFWGIGSWLEERFPGWLWGMVLGLRVPDRTQMSFLFRFSSDFRASHFLHCSLTQIRLGVNDFSGALCVLSNLGDLSTYFTPTYGVI